MHIQFVCAEVHQQAETVHDTDAAADTLVHTALESIGSQGDEDVDAECHGDTRASREDGDV